MAKQNLAEIQKQFPKGSKVAFTPGRSDSEVTAVVTGYRQAGVPGTRGHSIFIETKEERGGNLKPKERSIRPGTCRAA